MATQSVVNVTASGSDPIATYTQTWDDQSSFIQAIVLVDATSGTPAGVDANGLKVMLAVGTNNSSGPITASSIASAGSATLASSVNVTNGKTGTLQHAVLSSTQPTKWDIQTVNNSSVATTVFSVLTDANENYDFKPGSPGELSTVLASGSNVLFQVVATNNSTNISQTANAYAAFFWAEN